MRSLLRSILGTMFLIGLLTPDLAGDTVPAAELPPVFQAAEMTAMKQQYEDRLNRIRDIPAASLAEWEAHKAHLLKQALKGFGLDPLPDKVPLNLTYGDKHERDDSTIWRVTYQSFPGLYVRAALTIPKRAQFPAPAIVRLMGHEPNWEKGILANSAPLARRGYVVLAVRTEHVESLRIGLPIRGVQLWNNIRGLDVLCSLSQVDPTRIGAYVSSGGGMQTMDLAALDDRVQVAAPISYPAACLRLMGHCGCNHGPLRMLQFMDNHTFLAMIAPRPLAVTCVTGDWTRETPEVELPMVSRVYDLYRNAEPGPVLAEVTKASYLLFTNATGRFLAERFAGGHAEPPGMYVRTFRWFDWWLRDKKNEPCPAGCPEIGPYGGDVGHDDPFDTSTMKCDPPADARPWNAAELERAMAGKRH